MKLFRLRKNRLSTVRASGFPELISFGRWHDRSIARRPYPCRAHSSLCWMIVLIGYERFAREVADPAQNIVIQDGVIEDGAHADSFSE